MELANPKSKRIAKCHANQRFNQSFVKELALPSHKEKQKISPASQKLNLSTDKPADKKKMTIKLDNIDIQTIKHGRRKNHYPQSSRRPHRLGR